MFIYVVSVIYYMIYVPLENQNKSRTKGFWTKYPSPDETKTGKLKH